MHRRKYVIRLSDTNLWEEVMNGLVPCSLIRTGIFYTHVSVKMCRYSKFACFPGYNHAHKIWGKPVECRPVLSQLTNSWRGKGSGRQSTTLRALVYVVALVRNTYFILFPYDHLRWMLVFCETWGFIWIIGSAL